MRGGVGYVCLRILMARRLRGLGTGVLWWVFLLGVFYFFRDVSVNVV